MRLILDDLISDELKDYLMTQKGITDVKITDDRFLKALDIKYDKNITPEIIMKYIELFQNNNYSIL